MIARQRQNLCFSQEEKKVYESRFYIKNQPYKRVWGIKNIHHAGCEKKQYHHEDKKGVRGMMRYLELLVPAPWLEHRIHEKAKQEIPGKDRRDKAHPDVGMCIGKEVGIVKAVAVGEKKHGQEHREGNRVAVPGDTDAAFEGYAAAGAEEAVGNEGDKVDEGPEEHRH